MNNNTTLAMLYDLNTGGITGKSDAGTFGYELSEKPYAIKSIDPSTGLTPGNDQSVVYTSFNSVSKISENNFEADFIYDSGSERSQMVIKQNGNAILTRWYPTGSYIKETSGGVTKEYTFIGGGAYSAPAVAIKQNDMTKYYSIIRDHLGSITHIVDSTGTVIAEYSYDSWGRMRDPATWIDYTPGTEPELIIAGRGYTGHEHMPWFNTINMNGRIYDPLIGMFLSPDNYVQSPGNSQNFNRYSYCLNNPLSYSDPSGMLIEPKPSLIDQPNPPMSGWEASYMLCVYEARQGDYLFYESGGGSYVSDYIYESNLTFYGYTFDEESGKYWGRYTGHVASYEEVYYYYIVPNSSTNPQEIRDVIHSISFESSNNNSAENAQVPNQDISSNGSDDNCGVNSFEIVPNIEEAEKYIDDGCDKEKFFFITAEYYAIVGPWNDATRTACSPRQWDIFDKGKATIHNRNYTIIYGIHTQPDHPHPSPDDYSISEVLTLWGIESFIYHKGVYFWYNKNGELGAYPLKQELMNKEY